jgi:hypothetical protein
MSTIATFYSYKGGVGRTMALANVAVLLAKWGHKTLMVDWDLEAPGLEYYFKDYIDIQDALQRPGIVDMFLARSSDPARTIDFDWMGEHVIDIPVQSTTPLHLLTAGRKDRHYFERLRSFDIESFYNDKDGGRFVEALRDKWRQQYDFILIDSRTGVTDIGGVCTVQLPDILVLLFTANEQSLLGALDVARQASCAREELPFDRHCLLSLPIPSRFDTTEEYSASQEWLVRFANDTSDLYSAWLPQEISRRDFLAITKIPYMSYFSFGEKLPVMEQGTLDPAGLGFAYETLASLVANNLANSELLLRDRSGFVRQAWKEGGSFIKLELESTKNPSRIRKKPLRAQQIGSRIVLPAELLLFLRDTLIYCDEFSSQASLRSLFTVHSLIPYRDQLPEATSTVARVENVVAFLSDKRTRDGTSPLISLVAALKDRYDAADELHDRLDKLHKDLRRAMSNMEIVGETIEIPIVVAAMVAEEARQLFDGSIFSDPNVAPSEYQQFRKFIARWEKTTRHEWLQDYGPHREEWRPFSLESHSSTVRETITSVVDKINSGNLEKEYLQLVRAEFVSSSFFVEKRETRLTTWDLLRKSGGVLIVDAVSLFHPYVRQTISRSTVTTTNKVATVVISPSSQSTSWSTQAFSEILSATMEPVLLRCEHDLDRQVEIGLDTELAFRRWLYSILPEQAFAPATNTADSNLLNDVSYKSSGGVNLPGTSIRPPDKSMRKRCPHCGQLYSMAKIRRTKEGLSYHCPHCAGRV